MKKIITCICLTVFLSLSTFAQSNQDRARAYFRLAQTSYEKGDYQKTIDNLDKVVEFLGNSNPMTLSLRYKSYYQLKDYKMAQKSLNDFFKKSSNASQDLKDEATDFIIKIDEALEKEKKRESLEAVDKKAIKESLDRQRKSKLSNDDSLQFFSIASKTTLGLSEVIGIEFVYNQRNVENFETPKFKDFIVIGGPFQSISQGWINGKVSFTKSYVYYIKPKKKGSFVISEASADYNGFKRYSERIQIIVK